MVHADKPAGPCPLPGFWRDGSLASSVPLRYLGCFQALCCHQCFPSSCPSCSSFGERCTSLPVRWQRRKIWGNLLPFRLRADCPCIPVRSPSFLHFNTQYVYIPINTPYVYIPINTCYIYIPISGSKHFQEGGKLLTVGGSCSLGKPMDRMAPNVFAPTARAGLPCKRPVSEHHPYQPVGRLTSSLRWVCMQILRSAQMLSLSRRHPACSQGAGMSPQSCAAVCLSLMLVGKLGWGERKAPWVLWELRVG